ncbi:MAG: UbiD family decarboxylase [Chloroflexi bacterium]|nr:UbiD family decarboxylase [Chloroflexota bacterium]
MDLREFIQKIDEMGELQVIEGADPNLEIGAATYLAAKNQGNFPALIFDKIRGIQPGFRVMTLTYATDRRMNLLLGLPQDTNRIGIIKALRDKISQPQKLIPPVEVNTGPVLENLIPEEKVDLSQLPCPKWQSLDGGPYIGTGDMVITRDPEENWVNVGTYRIQVHERKTATIFMEPGKHADFIRRKYWAKGQACPVAVTLGGDPVHISVSGTTLPWKVPEYDYMGWWQGKPVEVIRGPVTGLPIPANAEIALEGEMLPFEKDSRLEGPFSEWTGHYTPARPEAAFHIKGIIHRDNPIILGQLPFLGCGVATGWTYLFRAARLWSHLDTVVPGVKGVWNHQEFGGMHCVVVSIEQKYGGHAKQTALSALGQFNYFRKFVIIVDEDIDPTNLKEVIWAIGMRSDPGMWDVVRECWSGNLNPILPPDKRAVKDFTQNSIMILACKPYYWKDSFPPRVVTDNEIESRVRAKWPQLQAKP